MQLIVGRVGNGAAEEDWCWDLNPGTAAIQERGSHRFGREGREDRAALAEWGPHGGNTVDGAGSLRYDTPDWEEGEGRTVCICGYSKGL